MADVERINSVGLHSRRAVHDQHVVNDATYQAVLNTLRDDALVGGGIERDNVEMVENGFFDDLRDMHGIITRLVWYPRQGGVCFREAVRRAK